MSAKGSVSCGSNIASLNDKTFHGPGTREHRWDWQAKRAAHAKFFYFDFRAGDRLYQIGSAPNMELREKPLRDFKTPS